MRMTEEQYIAAQMRIAKLPAAVELPPTCVVLAPAMKYRNVPTGKYHSKKEAKRAQALRLREQAGTIRNLREQVSFDLIPRQTGPDGKVIERACRYIADFAYEEAADPLSGPGWEMLPWTLVVEDVKSPVSRTADYIIKRKLMLYVHCIAVKET